MTLSRCRSHDEAGGEALLGCRQVAGSQPALPPMAAPLPRSRSRKTSLPCGLRMNLENTLLHLQRLGRPYPPWRCWGGGQGVSLAQVARQWGTRQCLKPCLVGYGQGAQSRAAWDRSGAGGLGNPVRPGARLPVPAPTAHAGPHSQSPAPACAPNPPASPGIRSSQAQATLVADEGLCGGSAAPAPQ